jgi:hypothetical protein
MENGYMNYVIGISHVVNFVWLDTSMVTGENPIVYYVWLDTSLVTKEKVAWLVASSVTEEKYVWLVASSVTEANPTIQYASLYKNLLNQLDPPWEGTQLS